MFKHYFFDKIIKIVKIKVLWSQEFLRQKYLLAMGHKYTSKIKEELRQRRKGYQFYNEKDS